MGLEEIYIYILPDLVRIGRIVVDSGVNYHIKSTLQLEKVAGAQQPIPADTVQGQGTPGHHWESRHIERKTSHLPPLQFKVAA